MGTKLSGFKKDIQKLVVSILLSNNYSANNYIQTDHSRRSFLTLGASADVSGCALIDIEK